MITGYNANVRHGERLFHVQTEDSGRSHPHVITHLYYQGTILASEKRDYAEILDAPDFAARVRRLMEEQHAAMVERLRGGDFDATIEARLAGGAPSASDSLTPPLPQPPPPSPPAARAPAAPAAAPGAPARPAARTREFGEGIVSPKPLDQVILDYLVEKSRDRKSGGGRGSRSDG
jgi:hypothetical protein